MEWQGKSVALVGVGISNLAVARYLVSQEALVTACDQKDTTHLGTRYDEMRSLGVSFQLGPDYLNGLGRFDYLFLSPGIPTHLPPLVAAQQAGVVLSSEMGLFFDLYQGPIIGVTGSSGKTTTTVLVGEMLSAAGYAVRVGGNIGKPLVDEAGEITPGTWVVLELSSFQLELLHRSPRISLVTNVTPNHLDIHPTMAHYIAAKKHVFSHQDHDDWLVLNVDDPVTRAMATEAPGRVGWFSRRQKVGRGACVDGNRVMLASNGELTEVCPVDQIRLPGLHNLENVLAAVTVADLAGCTLGAMRDVVTSFTGVSHRLELVREAEGISYYNDSKATTPAGAIAALRALQQPVILIAGGYDKHLPFDDFGDEIVERAKAVVLLGDTKHSIARAIEMAADRKGKRSPLVQLVTTFEEAVRTAKAMAEAGDAVLLSPACASFDMFDSFEARGDLFRGIVCSLTEAKTPLTQK